MKTIKDIEIRTVKLIIISICLFYISWKLTYDICGVSKDMTTHTAMHKFIDKINYSRR